MTFVKGVGTWTGIGTTSKSSSISYEDVDITTTSLTAGQSGSAYSQTINATGGDGSYVFSVSSGSLPGGLSLASNGNLTGTPTVAVTASFIVEADDERGAGNSIDTQLLQLIIDYANATITTTTLSGAVSGSAYTASLTATGGDGTFAWSVSSGSLPSGLSLNPTTGVISGSTGTTGSFNFEVAIDDGRGALSSIDSQSLSIAVTAPSSTPDWQEDWDYANTAAMLSGITDSTIGGASAGGITLLTGLTGTPWGGSKAMRCTFLAAGSGTDHQVGGTINMGSYGTTAQLREIWARTWCRWSANWSWDGPYSGGGSGHKHMLMFDNGETTAGRWDCIMGHSGNYSGINQLTFAGDYQGGSPITTPSGWSLGDLVDGTTWWEMWFYGLMDNSSGQFHSYLNGQLFTFGTGGDTDRDSGVYFHIFGLSRNQNNGKGSDQTLDWGPFQVWSTQPPDYPGA